MKSGKKGISLFLVLVVLSAFFMIVMGLLRQSSGELKHAKHLIAAQTAETIALSGIDWAEMELRKGRWYQPAFGENPSGGRPSFGLKSMTPPSESEGKLTVACQDVPSLKTGSNLRNMQKIWFLHHIDVFSLGEYSGSRCLVYAKFIISPEPALNGNSTEAIEYENPEFGSPFTAPIRVREVTFNGSQVQNFKVTKILVSPGQTVDINTPVAELTPVNGSAQKVELRPSTFGKVKDLFLKAGDLCKAGDNLGTLEKKITPSGQPAAVADTRTLKKMVRITKIDLSQFPNFDLNRIADRVSVAGYVDAVSDAFLINFVGHAALKDMLNAISDSALPDKLKDGEVFDKFPTSITNMTRERAENVFLTYLIKNFTLPGCKWDKKEQAKKESHLFLDHRKTAPPEKLLKKLDELGLANLLNSKPRKDDRYFTPKMDKDEFLTLLSPKFNLPVTDFVSQLSQLPDASRYVDIKEGNFPTSDFKETPDSILVTKADAKPYPVQVAVQKLPKGYSFVDPVNNFTIKMNDLVGFLKKIYSNEGSTYPKEANRVLEHMDWPLPKPAGTPPAAKEGFNTVWKPGVPGAPPGDPTWSYAGGIKANIPYPTGGSRDFERPGGGPDGGMVEYPVPGEVPISNENSNVSGGGAPPADSSSSFGNEHPPVTVAQGGTWEGKAGSAGVPPTEGSWEYVPKPAPGTSDSSSWCTSCKACCFIEGTLISMADGTKKPIEKVVVGEKVMTYDEKLGKVAVGTVKRVSSPPRDHLTTILCADKRQLQLTNDHPLMTKKGWASIDPEHTLTAHTLKVATLRVGDSLMDIGGTWDQIVGIETKLKKELKVFNLAKVEPNPNFYADGFLAHNGRAKGQDQTTTPGGPLTTDGGGNSTSGVPANPGTPGTAGGPGGTTPGTGDGGGTGLTGSGGPGEGNAGGAGADSPGQGGTAGGGAGKCPECGGPMTASTNTKTPGEPGSGEASQTGGTPDESGSSYNGIGSPGGGAGGNPGPSYQSYGGGV